MGFSMIIGYMVIKQQYIIIYADGYPAILIKQQHSYLSTVRLSGQHYHI